MSYAIVAVDLAKPLPSITLTESQCGISVLVRLRRRPVGQVLAELDPGRTLSPQQLGRLIANRLRFELLYSAISEELIPPTVPPPIPLTVCVLAHGEPRGASVCLRAVCDLAPEEVLVVAERPPPEVPELDELHPKLRILDASAKPLTTLLDRVLHEATGDYVAFLDETTIPDTEWLTGVSAGFTRYTRALMVTGPLVASELNTEAQVAFERQSEGHRGFRPLCGTHDPLAGAPLDPAALRIHPGLNNVAFDRSALLAAGPLSELTDIPRWALRHGFALAYEPSMLAFHAPPRERRGLRQRHRAWGAMLAKGAASAFRHDPAVRRAVVGLALRWFGYQAWELGRAVRGRAEADLTVAELAGAVTGLGLGWTQPPRAEPWPERSVAACVFPPGRIVHVNLARESSRVPPSDGDRLLVGWCGATPLGNVVLGVGEPSQPSAIWDRLAWAITPAVGDRLFKSGFGRAAPSRFPPPDPPAPPLDDLLHTDEPLRRIAEKQAAEPARAHGSASVIVCTRRRPAELERCLQSLMALNEPPDEILVIDNDPTDSRTAQVARRYPVSYIPEARAGLSVARNTGVRAATGELLAFTDDDVIVHPLWLTRLRLAFDDPSVMAVTGLVLPAELETSIQVVFEELTGQMGRGYRPITFDARFFDPQVDTGVPVWMIGAGANMAARRAAFCEVGLFDERLGAGASGCSEDSEFWYRLMAEGWQCRYDPEAVVFHRHRVDAAGLETQVRDYMRGHIAALFVQYARYRHPGNLRRALVTVPGYLLRRAFRELSVEPQARTRTLNAEIGGYLAAVSDVVGELSRKRTLRSLDPMASNE